MQVNLELLAHNSILNLFFAKSRETFNFKGALVTVPQYILNTLTSVYNNCVK